MLKDIAFGEKNKKTLTEVSSLSLAFLGDGVWSLLVRSFFCEKTNFKNKLLHSLSTTFVRASYQAEALDKIAGLLTEEESDVARRARNAKVHTVSKNASLADYKKATAFEAVLGHCYLKSDFATIEKFFIALKPDLEKELEKRKIR